jgi:hypothetical protein
MNARIDADPPPWTVEDHNGACFIVKDWNDQTRAPRLGSINGDANQAPS